MLSKLEITGEKNQVVDAGVIPNPGDQERFFLDGDIQRWRALLGGTGSGKTYAGVAEVIYWCMTYPGVEGVILEPVYRMINQNIIPILNSILGDPFWNNPLIESYNKGENLIIWAPGNAPDGRQLRSRTWLGSLDEPERIEGQSLDYGYLDELRLVRYVTLSLKVITRRLRGSAATRGLGYPIGAWITTTPDSPGSELHAFTEHPETKNPNCKVYRMSIFDNEQNLPPGYIAEVERGHTGGEYDQFVLGLFAAVEAGDLGFDYAVHVLHDFEAADGEIWLVDEKNEPITTLEAIRSYSYGHDFGWTQPAAQVQIGWDGDERAYVLDEFYQKRASDVVLADNLVEWAETDGEGIIWCDPSEPKTIRRLRDLGANRARRYKGKREDGLRELGSRFKLQGDGRYRLYIHRRCVNAISELQTYVAKKKERDHAVDAIRYGVDGERSRGKDLEVAIGKKKR
jgi:hypothetical protein